MKPDEKKQQRFQSRIGAFTAIVADRGLLGCMRRILVYGCGDGLEAGFLADRTSAEVHGIDLVRQFHPWAAQRAHLRSYDGRRLPYPDGWFDAVYSYHVLEHVESPADAAAELRRVLRPGGIIYLGVPNKGRLVGYIGIEGKPMVRRAWRNLRDWYMRLKGRWDNRSGAHAGFYEKELQALLRPYFRNTCNVSEQYFEIKWRNRFPRLGRILAKSKLAPSIFMLAFA